MTNGSQSTLEIIIPLIFAWELLGVKACGFVYIFMGCERAHPGEKAPDLFTYLIHSQATPQSRVCHAPLNFRTLPGPLVPRMFFK